MEEKKIYSLNKIAWLISAGIDVKLELDSNNKYYAIIKDDISDLLDKYRNNRELHKFLNSYKIIKEYIKNNK